MATKGEVYECRVARVLHHEGAFVRRAVDLNLQFGERFTVTDVDVLALTFLPSLRRQVTICECKTTTGSGPTAGDRILWGAGLRQLVPGADRHMIATVRAATDKVRTLAQYLNAEVIDQRDLERRERLLGLDPGNMSGPHDSAQVDLQKAVREIVRRDDELKRVWGFVRSEFWFSTPVYGLKRALGALRLVARRWHPDLPVEEAETIQWLAEEVIITAVVALIDIAGRCYRQPTDVFQREFTHSLAEGIVSYEQMQEISKHVDQYVLAVLKQVGVDPARHLNSLGALEPTVPSYAGALVEVVERLAAETRATAQIARLLDERIAARRGFPVPIGAPNIPDEQDASLLLATIATFLRAQLKLADDLLMPLIEEPTVTASRNLSGSAVGSGRGSGSNPVGQSDVSADPTNAKLAALKPSRSRNKEPEEVETTQPAEAESGLQPHARKPDEPESASPTLFVDEENETTTHDRAGGG